VKLILSPAAAADLERLREFLADRNPAAAERAIASLTRAMQSLDALPERGRPSGTRGVRELIVAFGRWCYILRYAYLAQTDEVVILRIWHAREARE
jgi:plasmid stabilization system protein ParE